MPTTRSSIKRPFENYKLLRAMSAATTVCGMFELTFPAIIFYIFQEALYIHLMFLSHVIFHNILKVYN